MHDICWWLKNMLKDDSRFLLQCCYWTVILSERHKCNLWCCFLLGSIAKYREVCCSKIPTRPCCLRGGGSSKHLINGEHVRFDNSHKDLGIIADTSLNLHTNNLVNKAAALFSNLLKTTLCRSSEFMKSLLIFHVPPYWNLTIHWGTPTHVLGLLK